MNKQPPDFGAPFLRPGTEWVIDEHPPRFNWKPERTKDGFVSEFEGYLYNQPGYEDADYEQWEARTINPPFERYQSMHLRSRYPKT